MKRFLKISLLCMIILLCLTSCTVNWFGETREAPWWTIAIPVVVVSIAGCYFIYSATYVCPRCGFEFKPKWYELSALVHMGRARIMKCPSCGKRGYCKPKK
jgi:DNA-directed RNA polymerase subunit RPC12/RpoP